MKLILNLIINAGVTLCILVGYDYFFSEPRLSYLGHIVYTEAEKRANLDKKIKEIEKQIYQNTENESVYLIHKNGAKTGEAKLKAEQK